MLATLYRYKRTETETIGVLFADGRQYFILEPPWKDNQRNISCIPAGTYKCVFMKRSSSGKYKNIYWVQDVPNRTAILIHAGNTHDHTRGCLIPGKRTGKLAGKNAVLNSRSALMDLRNIFGKSFTLEVIDGMVS